MNFTDDKGNGEADYFAAREEGQKMTKLQSWRLLRSKIIESDLLLREISKIKTENEVLHKDKATWTKEKKDHLEKYNIKLEKITQLELDNEEYKNNLKKFKETIESQQIKLNEKEQLIYQLKCKIESEEDKNKSLEIENKFVSSKVHEKKPTVSLTHQECQTSAQWLQDDIDNKKFLNEYKETVDNQQIKLKENEKFIYKLQCKIKIMEDKNKNLEIENKFIKAEAVESKPNVPLKNQGCQTMSIRKRDFSANTDYMSVAFKKPIMIDKNEWTDECITISKEPFPIFCTKCKVHISPPPIDQILNIMTIEPPMNISPPSSPKLNNRTMKNNSIVILDESKELLNKKIPLQTAKVSRSPYKEIDKLKKKLFKLEKKINKNEVNDNNRNSCCAKNIKFIVQYPNEYRKHEKRKVKPVKRLTRTKKKVSVIKKKWQVENCLEPKKMSCTSFTETTENSNINKISFVENVNIDESILSETEILSLETSQTPLHKNSNPKVIMDNNEKQEILMSSEKLKDNILDDIHSIPIIFGDIKEPNKLVIKDQVQENTLFIGNSDTIKHTTKDSISSDISNNIFSDEFISTLPKILVKNNNLRSEQIEHTNSNSLCDESSDAQASSKDFICIPPVSSETSNEINVVTQNVNNDSTSPSVSFNNSLPVTPEITSTTSAFSDKCKIQIVYTKSCDAAVKEVDLLNYSSSSFDKTGDVKYLSDSSLTLSNESNNEVYVETQNSDNSISYNSLKTGFPITPEITSIIPVSSDNFNVNKSLFIEKDTMKKETDNKDSDISCHISPKSTACASSSLLHLSNSPAIKPVDKISRISCSKASIELPVVSEFVPAAPKLKEMLGIVKRLLPKNSNKTNVNNETEIKHNIASSSSIHANVGEDIEKDKNENDLSFEEQDFLKTHLLPFKLTFPIVQKVGNHNDTISPSIHTIKESSDRENKCSFDKAEESPTEIFDDKIVSDINIFANANNVGEDIKKEKSILNKVEESSITKTFNKKINVDNIFEEINDSLNKTIEDVVNCQDSSDESKQTYLSSGIKRRQFDNITSSYESLDENSVETPVKKRRKKLGIESVRTNLGTTTRKTLISNIRNLKKNSKKLIISSTSKPCIPQVTESASTSLKQSSELLNNSSTCVTPVKSTSKFEKDKPSNTPIKKQRIAHMPKSVTTNENTEFKDKTIKKCERIKGVSKKVVDEGDKLTSLIEEIEKTGKERAEFSRKQRKKNIHNQSDEINLTDLMKNNTDSDPSLSENNSLNNSVCTNVKVENSSNSVFISNVDINNKVENSVNIITIKTENVNKSTRTIAQVLEMNQVNLPNNEIKIETNEGTSSIKSENQVQENKNVSTDSGEDKRPVRELRSRQIVMNKQTGKNKKTKKANQHLEFPDSINETNSCLSDSVVISILNDCVFKGAKNFKCSQRNKNYVQLKNNGNLIYEQLQILMDAEQWTTEIQAQVMEKLISSRDLNTIALFLIEYTADKLNSDEELDREHTPPAPMMKRSEQKLVVLILNISKVHPEFMDIVLGGLQYKLFKLGEPQQVQIVERLFRLLVVLNKIRKNREQVRIAMCDALYCMKLRAINVIHVALSCWSEVLPKYNCNTDILVKTMVHIIMTIQVENVHNKLNSLRKWLSTYYGYPDAGYQTDVLVAELLQGLQSKELDIYNVPGIHSAILLLCKKMESNWTLTHIVPAIKSILVSQSNSSSLFEDLTLLGNILRSFAMTNSDAVCVIIDQLSDVLAANTGSDDLQEGIVSCLSSISRFKFEEIVRSVMKWQSKKDLRPVTKEKVNSLFKSRDVHWWWTFIKHNFPLPR